MKDSNKIFAGLLFLIAAALIVLNALGYSLAGVGPLYIVLSILLAACFIKSLTKLSIGGMLFSAAFLVIIYAEPLNIPKNLIPWPVLAVALLATIGLNLIFKRSIDVRFRKKLKVKLDKNEGHFSESVGNLDGEYIYERNSFGGSTRYVKSQNLSHAELSNQFGELKVYFDDAKIPSGYATISVNNSFGEVVLYIPRRWRVENHSAASFGNVDEETYSTAPKDATVVIDGSVTFGNMKILYI